VRVTPAAACCRHTQKNRMVREKPPASPKVVEKKKRARSKSVRRGPTLSPFQERLKETDFYTKPKFDDFLSIPAVKDRLLLVHSLLSEDVTDISRAWPLQLKTKDSRLRRELSDAGKECFVRGETDKVLQYYNKAILYSTGKGVAHTLARRAAFFLATDDHKLAVRDLSVALEYGGLETELLDFLLIHHTQDEEKIRAKNEAAMERTIDTIKNAKLDMQNATTSDISKWAEEIRANLSKAAKVRKNDPGGRKIKDDILKNIINSVKQASKETNLDENIEIEELEVPTLKEKNPLCPAFSEAARIGFHTDRGRTVLARRDIKAGEIICVDDPTCAMLCPDVKDSIYDHCVNCFRFTKAPLPCDNCCSVVFCSKKCKDLANQTFHRIECQLKLYEMFEHESKEIFALFMALRAVTQKPLQYFTENQKEIEKFLDLEEPTFPFPGRAYQSGDYRALCNLMTHVGDIDPDVAMKNSVLSVFFLRFIQKTGYFSKISGTGKLKGDKSLGSTETFILRLIHQVICAQAYNSHSVHKLTKAFQWERIGTAINPSLALVNHSCDSNSVRCNVNKSSILVAARHIPEGEEITDTYSGHFRDTSKHQREYYTLKNYMFECECAACKENWPQEDEIPDELFRVPNFEQEKIYKVRHGDKKDLVKEVIEVRRAVEKSMTHKRFSEALLNYQPLCQKLEEHLRRPHIYFLQARSGITHCIWNLYCTRFPELPIEDSEDECGTNQEHAKLIYQNNMSEQVSENNGLELGPSEVDTNLEPVVDEEKAALLESTRKLLEQSTQKVQTAVTDTQNQKDKYDQQRQMAQDAFKQSDIVSVSQQNGCQETNGIDIIKVNDLINNTQTTKEEAEKNKQRQAENEMREKEQRIRAEKKKQWEAEEKERLEREKARKLKREQEAKENLKREKEREEMRKRKKREEEQEKIKLREKEYEKRMAAEKEKRQKQEEERQRKKKEEEEELQLLLMEIGEDLEIDATLEEVPIENSVNEHSAPENGTVVIQKNGFNEAAKLNEKDFEKESENKTAQLTKKTKNTDDEVKELTQEISFTNMIGLSNKKENSSIPISKLTDNNLPNTEPANVWSSLRKIKESDTDYKTIFNSKTDKPIEVVSVDDIDDMIKDLAQQIADKRSENKPTKSQLREKEELSNIKEEEEEEEEVKESAQTIKENIVINNNTGIQTNMKPFNFEIWKSEMDAMFGPSEEPLEKKAADDLYIKNLRQKIQISVEKANKENKNKVKTKDKTVDKNETHNAPAPSNVDDFALLKLKEKERKKKKQDAKFQQKVVDNTDKMKEMSNKTKKIEKISLESEEELQKIRDMAKKLIAKSEAKENEFNEIFLNLDNLENINVEGEKKKGKRGRKKMESIQKSVLENELHWTEEENNKWQSQDKGVSKVTNVLAALKAAAENGQSNFVAESLKETISNYKKMEQEDEEERRQEKIRQKEEERQKIEEEIKKKKSQENEEKKRKELEERKKKELEEKKKKDLEERKMKEIEERNKKELEERKKKELQERNKKDLEERNKKEVEDRKKKEIEIEKQQQAKEKQNLEKMKKEAEIKLQKENLRNKEKKDEEKKKAEKNQRLEREKEEELKRKNKSAGLQKAWEEKEKQRIESEEEKKRIAEEERLIRQEEFLLKMKIEEERKKKERIARIEEERKVLEEQKANELKLKEIKRAREEETKKKEQERKEIAARKLKDDMEKRKKEEEMKIKAEQERKENEARVLKQEREKLDKMWEEKKKKEKEEEMKMREEDEIAQRRKNEEILQIKIEKERQQREEETANAEKKKEEDRIEKYKKEKQIEDAKWLKKKEEMIKSNEEEREKKEKEEEQKNENKQRRGCKTNNFERKRKIKEKRGGRKPKGERNREG